MRLDDIILTSVLTNFEWQQEEIDFVASSMSDEETYDLIDIGANVGLFSLQMLNKFGGRIDQTFCFEPDEQNFACLSANLGKFGQRAVLHHCGLAESDRDQDLFVDLSNAGNYSLLPSAMEQQAFSSKMVKIRSTSAVMTTLAARSTHPILWKSDTQGFDEIIVNHVPEDVWARVRCAIIEIAGLSEAKFDRETFLAKIKPFKTIRLGAEHGDVDLIRRFWDSGAKGHVDLHIRR